MAEAERVLRSNKFIEDAVILIDQVADGQVDLLVIVNDVFSLVPELGYYSPTKFTTGIVDANLAGSTNFLGVGMLYDKDAIKKSDLDCALHLEIQWVITSVVVAFILHLAEVLLLRGCQKVQ
jgi:hypothetical protein